MEEGPLTMVFHGFLFAVVIYLILAYGLQQPEEVARTRSTLAGLLIASYMIAFGHGLPTRVNPLL